MCGIAGFWQATHFSADDAQAIAGKMADQITHRGPDDAGVWVDESVGVAFAHRRLSILDLSPAGHQPMKSHSGRYVIAFNGEIYNHLSLRTELEADFFPLQKEGHVGWQGHSDTETLLAAFQTWGIEATLKKAVGMFAIALWDRAERTLTLARDRLGEKPLYYGFQKDTLVFGSELKALKVHPHFIGEVDRDVICLFLRHCCIPAPYSIFKGIQKLLPGNYIQFPLGRHDLRSVKPKVYWSLAEVAADDIAQPFIGSDSEAISLLEKQLKKSIGLQMIADVPLGAFLSGGVDSSTVVALMQAQSSLPIKTFSIGFDKAGFNEAEYAKAVAQHIGTDHVEYYVSSREARQIIPRLAHMYDEPFADSSQIPTFLVSQIARKHVAVALSGDGGDELFCGYNRYALTDIWKKISRMPFGVRRLTGRVIKTVSPSMWDAIFLFSGKFLHLPSVMGEKLEKLSLRLESVDGVEDLYYSLVSMIPNPEQIVIGAKEPGSWLTEVGLKTQFSDAKLQMMFLDCMTYLPDDILVKVDRAAMSNSLETRVPLLDHRVVELAWSLPLSMKMRNGQTKWLLRQVLYKYVPKQLIERPKMGFGIPMGDWIRGPLRGWVEELIDEKRLRQEGFFDVQFIRRCWCEHLAGKRDWQFFLWSVLMFQAWLGEN